MKQTSMHFGGDWTVEKLRRVEEYLKAYISVMKKKSQYKKLYIDAFAGTGYIEKEDKDSSQLLLPEIQDPETKKYIEGSARKALGLNPGFDEYNFIEKNKRRARKLEDLKKEYPQKNITIYQEDSNMSIKGICNRLNWGRNRAVIFLDPFGMQVEWSTIEAIARTKAIDLWYLFPIGAINRLLTKDGKIDALWKDKLNKIFGCQDWFGSFYKTEDDPDMFGKIRRTFKIADFENIGKYFVERLKKIFADVAPMPRVLENSKNSQLFLLSFACGNKYAAPIAIRIANHILSKR